jgi:hypothetical protein
MSDIDWRQDLRYLRLIVRHLPKLSPAALRWLSARCAADANHAED